MANNFAGRLDWSDWVRGLFAGFIGGGAGAFSGGLSTAIVDPDHYNLAHPQKILTVIGSTFLINGGDCDDGVLASKSSAGTTHHYYYGDNDQSSPKSHANRSQDR